MQLPTTPRSLRLVVDANILLGELLRQRGIDLLADSRLDLSITARAWNEVEYELPKRIHEFARRRPDPAQTEAQTFQRLLAVAERNVTSVEESVYVSFEKAARSRIPDDPDDWPTVALAFILAVPIWTEDRHFLGRGLATWRTDALREYLTQIDSE